MEQSTLQDSLLLRVPKAKGKKTHSINHIMRRRRRSKNN